MDNRHGQFETITEQKWEDQLTKPEPLVFKEGEIIVVRGSRLRVHKIYKNKITFKLLPAISVEDMH